MGWGASADGKRLFLGNALSYTGYPLPDHAYDAVVIDCNAVLRHLLTGDNTMTPRQAIYVFLKGHVAPFGSSRCVVFCFDTPARVPLARHAFYQQLRYKPQTRSLRPGEVRHGGRIYRASEAPVSDDEILNLTADSKVNWPRFWNS